MPISPLIDSAISIVLLPPPALVVSYCRGLAMVQACRTPSAVRVFQGAFNALTCANPYRVNTTDMNCTIPAGVGAGYSIRVSGGRLWAWRGLSTRVAPFALFRPLQVTVAGLNATFFPFSYDPPAISFVTSSHGSASLPTWAPAVSTIPWVTSPALGGATLSESSAQGARSEASVASVHRPTPPLQRSREGTSASTTAPPARPCA